jgi:LuxR family maltose regulon positive regulatory protein
LDALPNGRSVGAHGHAPLQVAWLSLDKEDNKLPRFLSYVVAALQTVESNVGQEALAVLESPGAINVEAFLTILLNAVAGPPDAPSAGTSTGSGRGSGQDLVLVLDDYYVIESREIGEALTFILDYLPPHMHLVIATRSDPFLPLPRLRAGAND